jgi:hypothetical protein
MTDADLLLVDDPSLGLVNPWHRKLSTVDGKIGVRYLSGNPG